MTTRSLFRSAAAGWTALTLLTAALGCSPRGGSGASGKEATLDEVNRALAVWSMREGRPPQHLGQLTNSAILQGKVLPKPPPGQKLALDPQTRQAVFVAE
jgi:hypothetical protein